MPEFFYDDADRLARTGLSAGEYRHHVSVIEDHGGTSLRARCPEHGTRSCDERVRSWTVLAEAGFLPSVAEETAL